jgi:hypothetical protein
MDDTDKVAFERAKEVIAQQGSNLTLEQVTAQRDLWILTASEFEARMTAAETRLAQAPVPDAGEVGELVHQLERAVEYDTRCQDTEGLSAPALQHATEKRLKARADLLTRLASVKNA